jgi:hypothetical protein
MIPLLNRGGLMKLYKARHLVEMSWQEQLDDNKLNSSPHIGDFNDDR